jgi:putative FmdB family regulatory protein
MAIYEYTCAGCGNTEDVMVKLSDAPDHVKCDCGDKKTRVLFPQASRVLLNFAGAGWPGQDMKLNDRKNSGDIASIKHTN